MFSLHALVSLILVSLLELAYNVSLFIRLCLKLLKYHLVNATNFVYCKFASCNNFEEYNRTVGWLAGCHTFVLLDRKLVTYFLLTKLVVYCRTVGIIIVLERYSTI